MRSATVQIHQKSNPDYVHGECIVQVPAQWGEDLFRLLASEGIDATLVPVTGTSRAVLEMDEDVNLQKVQAVLHRWGH